MGRVTACFAVFMLPDILLSLAEGVIELHAVPG
jgi:hypothetical protein